MFLAKYSENLKEIEISNMDKALASLSHIFIFPEAQEM